MAPIGAVGFELWTMSANIIFDNIIVADDEELAEEFAKQTFDVKTVQEKLFEQVNNPPESLVSNILETTKEKPWLWAVFVLVLLIPVIFISVYCFGSKSTPSYSSRAKKTDEAQADDLLVGFFLIFWINFGFLICLIEENLITLYSTTNVKFFSRRTKS